MNKWNAEYSRDNGIWFLCLRDKNGKLCAMPNYEKDVAYIWFGTSFERAEAFVNYLNEIESKKSE